MPPKAAETSMKKFIKLEVMNLIFSEKFCFSAPTAEEIQAVKHIAEFMPEDLDGRDAWIYHNFVETDSE